MRSLQSDVEQRGTRIFELVDKHPERLFSKAGFYQRLMALSMHDERFKTQLFRFVAVLPSLRRSNEIIQHLGEYFSDSNDGFHPLVGVGVRMARLIPWISAPVLRWNVSEMARQFIAGRNPHEVIATLRKRRAQKIGFTVDVLGEAVVSEAEADEHAAFYGDLLEKLTRETRDWTDPLEKNADLFPIVNLSVKISALYSQITPDAPAEAIAHVSTKLRPLLNHARDLGAVINIDMESYALKNTTLQLFKAILTEPEFKDWPHAGIVIQAYLRDSEADLLDLIEWGRTRGTRFAVRLVKGAYWDYETTKSGQNGSNPPVFLQKPQSDANFEKLTRVLFQNNSVVTPAFGSHNVRSIAHAQAGDRIRNAPLVSFIYKDSQDKMQSALREARKRLGEKHPLFIGGEKIWTDNLTPSVNPAEPTEIVGYGTEAGIDEAEHAVKAARAAFETWRWTPFEERARLLERAADILERRRYELSGVEGFEVGKPWSEADADIREAIDFCNFYAQQMRRLGRPKLTQQVPGEDSYHHYWPRGVAFVIAPWNFPIAILCGMASAGVVTGNAVIMKPSEQSIICGAMLMEVFEEAGLPPGVLNFLSGHGSVIGAPLVDHKDVDLIGFTGSREVGLKIWESAGITRPGQRELKRVICEMGGKNAMILDADADLDETIMYSIYSAFGFQGQKCSALSRLILLEEIYDRVLERLIPAAAS